MTKDHTSHEASSSHDGPYRRVGILVLISVIIIAVFLGISVIARGFGGNEKRLAEAFITTLQEPYINGSFGMSNQTQVNKFELEGKLQYTNGEAAALESEISLSEEGGEDIQVPVDVRVNLQDTPEYYIKASALEEVARPFGEMMPAINADLISIADKIDSRWLRYAPEGDETQGCAMSIFEAMQDNEDAVKELTRAYMSHRFINVNSVDKKSNSTQVYKVAVDNDTLTKFTKKLYQTDFVGDIDACQDAVKEAELPTPSQPQQQPTPEQTAKTSITVRDGLIVSMSASNAAQQSAGSFSIALDFDENDITMPSEDIVESSTIQHEMKSITEYILEQQQQATQQQAPGMSGPAMRQP